MIRLLTLAFASLLIALPATAQDVSFELGAATDNRSKDISKSDGDAYVWGDATWSDSSGVLYGGPAFETIKAGGSTLELSPNVGVAPEWGGFEWDFNAAYKYRVDADAGYDPDAWEFTADMARAVGPAKGRVRVQHSPDGAGSTGAWTWVSARATWEFTSRLRGLAEIGHRSQENAPDYVGWSAGFRYALNDTLELDVRYHATDADDAGRQYEDALVAGISASF